MQETVGTELNAGSIAAPVYYWAPARLRKTDGTIIGGFTIDVLKQTLSTCRPMKVTKQYY